MFLKGDVLAFNVKGYDYIGKDDGLRKLGAELCYMTGELVQEPFGNNFAAGLEVVVMGIEKSAVERVVQKMKGKYPAYYTVSFTQGTFEDRFGTSRVGLTVVDVEFLAMAHIGPEQELAGAGPVNSNGAAAPVGAGR